MAKTNKPTGLSIARDGNKLICTWKKGDKDYKDGQQFQYRWGKGSWIKTVNVTKTQTKVSITIPIAKYNPTTKKKLPSFEFRVRGNKDGSSGWSAWAEKTFDFDVPRTPVVTQTLDSSLYNRTLFSWTTETSNTNHREFRSTEWQSILVRNCTEKDPSKLTWNSSQLGWMSGTGSASGSKTITESGSLLADASYTRWFRVRSHGVAGHSEWKTVKHVYARTNAAVITSVDCKEMASGYTCTVKWQVQSTIAKPVDYSTLQYRKAVPAAEQACPSDETGWVSVASSGRNAKDGKTFPIGGFLDEDECLFVRVNTYHDREEVLGNAVLVRSGALKAPLNLEVTTSATTHTVDVSADNNSEVPDSYMVVVFRSGDEPDKDINIGIIPAGSTRRANIKCPDWSDMSSWSIGVYAAQGPYSDQERAEGFTEYVITPNMVSTTVWESGATTPVAPSGLTLIKTDAPDKILARWNFDWEEGDFAELSWSDDLFAWVSSDEPQRFTTDGRATSWYIDKLTPGKTWFVRVRLCTDSINGPWSDVVAIDLATKPGKPILSLSDTRIKTGGSIEARWTYYNNDGTEQGYAEVRVDGHVMESVESSQSAILYLNNLEPGQTVDVDVRVWSASGRVSDWSDPVQISIAPLPEISIASTSLVNLTITDDDSETRTVKALREMPLDIELSTTGDGVITAAIERAKSYYMERPDGTRFDGYEGETIAIIERDGPVLVNDHQGASISISNDDLQGLFDDGAPYRLVVTIRDQYGQKAEAELEFDVAWTHQAGIPDGTVLINTRDRIAYITPKAPDGAVESDRCDIYRLSVDRPELIVEGAIFGEQYVDPYPTLGEFGGYRLVTKTANGDYITADNVAAWVDIETNLAIGRAIIDFDGERVELEYNIQGQHSWAKGFTQTAYLGGAVQGDWDAAVRRSGTISATAITAQDQDTMQAIRRLADYPGICHVRTPDGSSFAADVQVTINNGIDTAFKTDTYNLTINRVDAEDLDGLLLSEWEDEV